MSKQLAHAHASKVQAGGGDATENDEIAIVVVKDKHMLTVPIDKQDHQLLVCPRISCQQTFTHFFPFAFVLLSFSASHHTSSRSVISNPSKASRKVMNLLSKSKH
jgi:hypothetical protein